MSFFLSCYKYNKIQDRTYGTYVIVCKHVINYRQILERKEQASMPEMKNSWGLSKLQCVEHIMIMLFTRCEPCPQIDSHEDVLLYYCTICKVTTKFRLELSAKLVLSHGGKVLIFFSNVTLKRYSLFIGTQAICITSHSLWDVT